jgi:hypothetical protein
LSIWEEPGQKVVLIYKSRYAEVMLSGSILISGSWDTNQNVSREVF